MEHNGAWQAARDYKWLSSDFDGYINELIVNRDCIKNFKGDLVGARILKFFYLYVLLFISFVFSIFYLFPEVGFAGMWLLFFIVVIFIVKGRSFWGATWEVNENIMIIKTMGCNKKIALDAITKVEFHLHRSTFELRIHCEGDVIKLYDPYIEKIYVVYCFIVSERENLSLV